MKLEDYRKIPGVELRSMTTKELKQTLTHVSKHTNARLSRLKKQGLEKISKSGDIFLKNYPTGLSIKTATDRNELIRQITAGQRFLSGSTSTVRGTKKMIKNIMNIAEIEYDKNTLISEFKDKFGSDFWEIYRKLSEENKSYKEDSDGLIQAVSDIVEKGDDLSEDEKDDLMVKARKRYEEKKLGKGVSFVSNEDLSTKYSRKNN